MLVASATNTNLATKHEKAEHVPKLAYVKKKRVNWIGAITIVQVRSYAITIRLFVNLPLQFPLYRTDAILYA